MNEVFVPAMGMAPDDVVLVSWLKQPGDAVATGEPVALVETSKAELEVESPADGALGHHLFPEKASIAPGTVITHVLSSGEAHPAPDGAIADDPPTEPNDPPTAHGATPDSVAAPAHPPGGTGQRSPHLLSPRQRRERAEAAGSAGPIGRGEPGPSATVAAGPAGAGAVRSPAVVETGAQATARPDEQDRFRAAISASVTRSWQEIPHFTVVRELRVGALVDAVAQWRAVLPALTLTDLLLRGFALSLLDRERRSDLDIGLAVATDRGVAIPVIRDVPRLGLVELVDARTAAVRRARQGRLAPDDGRVPAATLSNLGAVGVDQFTGVVPYGQTCLLTVGAAAPRPVVDDGGLAVATTMSTTLNVDHRAWDGHHAGELLARLARVLAAPAVFLGPVASTPAGPAARTAAREDI